MFIPMFICKYYVSSLKIPMGFAAACTARIGQALGAGNVDDAKLTVKVAISACSKYAYVMP